MDFLGENKTPRDPMERITGALNCICFGNDLEIKISYSDPATIRDADREFQLLFRRMEQACYTRRNALKSLIASPVQEKAVLFRRDAVGRP